MARSGYFNRVVAKKNSQLLLAGNLAILNKYSSKFCYCKIA